MEEKEIVENGEDLDSEIPMITCGQRQNYI
jgi:hypothetical protein